MAKLMRIWLLGLAILTTIIVAGCSGSDKDTIRDLPDPAPKAGHGRTHKPVPPLVEAPGGTALAPGQKAKN